MIRIQPDEAPRILRDRGVTLTGGLCRNAEAGEPLSFDRDVYGAQEVKQALSSAQHDKYPAQCRCGGASPVAFSAAAAR